MKFKVKPNKKKIRGSRGPAPTVSERGSTRMTFFLPDPFRERVDRFNKLAAKNKVRPVILSTCFREGGKMYMDKQEKMLYLATEGKLHAKRRKE